MFELISFLNHLYEIRKIVNSEFQCEIYQESCWIYCYLVFAFLLRFFQIFCFYWMIVSKEIFTRTLNLDLTIIVSLITDGRQSIDGYLDNVSMIIT